MEYPRNTFAASNGGGHYGNLHNALDAISAIGDQDECSIKHVMYSLKAIMTGKTWKDGYDYPDPGSPRVSDNAYLRYEEEGEDYESLIDPEFPEFQERYISAKWEIVQEIFDKIGPVAFEKLLNAKYE